MSGQATTTSPNWKAIEIYEHGKERRYQLLFTVNAGALALIGFLTDKVHALSFSPIGVWAFIIIPLALAWYSNLMCDDILAFEEKLHKHDHQEIFLEAGKKHLKSIRIFFIAGWILAVLLIVCQWVFMKPP